MRWQTKSLIQSVVARLPDRASYPIHFRLQRHFGNLRRGRLDPTKRLFCGMEFCRQIVAQGRSLVGSSFLEVGTGWRLNLPIACWLCGADRVTTLDLNPYLSFPLVLEDLRFLRERGTQVFERLQTSYGDLIDADRWNQLLAHHPANIADFCELCSIDYQAPADACHTSCESHSIDFHVSSNVFEHVPGEVLTGMLQEANRILKPTGLLLHRVDHTDHFSHSDRSLSRINFLQFSDQQWDRFAGKRYAYVNRHREDDYVSLFQDCGQQVLTVDSQPDVDVLQLLDGGFPLDARFRDKSPETLARLSTLFVAAPSSALQSALSDCYANLQSR
jgi:SAM-dependent methyltransferase